MIVNILLVCCGGFFGAISRYSTTIILKRIMPGKIPAGTITVNLLGSFLLGMLLGIGGNEKVILCLGTGFMGAFTTFSTFNLEVIQLKESKAKTIALLYLFLTYIGAIAFAFLGIIIGKG